MVHLSSILTLQKCFFPQNLRSFGYKSGLPRFHAFHPYLRGHGHDGTDGARAPFDGGHRCGVLVNNFQGCNSVDIQDLGWDFKTSLGTTANLVLQGWHFGCRQKSPRPISGSDFWQRFPAVISGGNRNARSVESYKFRYVSKPIHE